MPPLFLFFMQRLSQDATEMAELHEELTQAQAATIMARVRATHAERTTWEKNALLATAHGEVVEAAQRVFALGDELVAACRAWEAIEDKILSLVAKMVTADQQQEATEEQCECLLHELTLLSLRGSELCITITGAPLLAPA
jgi:dihydroxyacetone kinase-like predicted kinase